MLHIVLYQPEIPPNTGNVIRLCANSGFQLHLIEPLGFVWDDKRLIRAGLDYHEFADVKRFADLSSFQKAAQPGRIFAFSTHGTHYYHKVSYLPGDALVFGPETRGLPKTIRDSIGTDHTLRIPMKPASRSMNLANTVALVSWEAWRQLSFDGGL